MNPAADETRTHNQAADPPKVHRIFFGSDGLRAGWSLLIFVALFAVLMFAANGIGSKLAPQSENPMSLSSGFIGEAFPLMALLLATWVMSKIERRPAAVYGLGVGTHFQQGFQYLFAGLAWGVSCLSLLVLALWKTKLLVVDRRLLFGSDILRYGALWFICALLVGLLEEYLMRGYLQYTLTRVLTGLYQWALKTRRFEVQQARALAFWTAALLLSVLFGLGHGNNPGESPIGLLSAACAGMVFCFSLWRTESLWWAIGMHASWDWAQSFLYGVGDSGHVMEHRLLATHPVGPPILSGGATGPEGSVFILPLLTLIVLIVVFTLPRTPPKPQPA